MIPDQMDTFNEKKPASTIKSKVKSKVHELLIIYQLCSGKKTIRIKFQALLLRSLFNVLLQAMNKQETRWNDIIQINGISSSTRLCLVLGRLVFRTYQVTSPNVPRYIKMLSLLKDFIC